MTTLQSFINYVSSFYGTEGIYAQDCNGGFSDLEITNACKKYFRETTQWGGGDSLDRENVRTILQPTYSSTN